MPIGSTRNRSGGFPGKVRGFLTALCLRRGVARTRGKANGVGVGHVGRALAARGGKSVKKRAAVAVARKLSVLLLRLWVSGEVYEPLRNARLRGEMTPASR